MRIGMLALGGWLVAAVLTVGVSWSAISVVRDAVAAGPEVESGLPGPEESTAAGPQPTRTAPTGSSPTASSPTASPTPAPVRIAVATGSGGTATVRCVAGRPQFLNLVPKPHYRIERDDNGAEVKFRSTASRTEITASCAGGVPRVTAEDKAEGGGGDNSSGGGRGGGGDDN